MKLRQLFALVVIMHISILCYDPCFKFEDKDLYSEIERENFFSLKKYKYSKIGMGGQAKILKGTKLNSEDIAVKLYREKDQAGKKDELNTLQEITCNKEFKVEENADCVNLVRLKGIGYKKKFSKSFVLNHENYSGKQAIIVLDYYPFNLNSLISQKNFDTKLPYRSILIDVLKGLSCLHKAKYIHKDIKPDNILLDKNYKAYLADYGLLDREDGPRTFGGTMHYVAPEILRAKDDFNATVDVYSFGIMVFEILYGFTPLESYAKKHLKSIYNGKAYEELAFESFKNIKALFPKEEDQRVTLDFKINKVLKKYVLVHYRFRITADLLKKVFELNFTQNDVEAFRVILRKRFSNYVMQLKFDSKYKSDLTYKTSVDKIDKDLKSFLVNVKDLISKPIKKRKLRKQ